MHATGGPGTNTAYGVSKLAQRRFIEMLAVTEPDTFSVAIHPGNVKTKIAKVVTEGILDGKNIYSDVGSP